MSSRRDSPEPRSRLSGMFLVMTTIQKLERRSFLRCSLWTTSWPCSLRHTALAPPARAVHCQGCLLRGQCSVHSNQGPAIVISLPLTLGSLEPWHTGALVGQNSKEAEGFLEVLPACPTLRLSDQSQIGNCGKVYFNHLQHMTV